MLGLIGFVLFLGATAFLLVQVKRKKPQIWAGISMGVTALVFMIGVVSCASSSTSKSAASDTGDGTSSSVTASTTTSASDPAKPADKPIEKVNKIGDSVQAGKFDVVVQGVEQKSQVGDDFLNKKAQGVYWIIKVNVKNEDNKARTVDSSMFHIVDSSGATYDPDSEADIYANKDSGFFLNDVNPHLSANGYIVFDMPTDAKDLTLKVDSGVMFAGGDSVNISLGQ